MRIRDHAPCGGLAPTLPCLGKVYKPFKPSIRLPNYIDDKFLEYIELNNLDVKEFSTYLVVPKKNLEYAEKSLLRYSLPSEPFEDLYVQRLFEDSIEALDQIMRQHMCDSVMYSYDKVLSELKALKSPGYPWNLMYQYKIDYWASFSSEFFDHYWSSLETIDPIRTLCNVSLKEELRLASKIEDGNVRSIIAMDVNHVVSHCILSMSQNEALKAHLFESPFMLGLNLLYGGADKLVHYMTPPEWAGPCSIELDGRKFDGTIRQDPHFKGIAELRWRWLRREYRTPQNKQRLRNIYRDLSYSPLINIDGHVFGRKTGGPSGHGCTTPDNSFKNWMDVYVLWCLCVPEPFANVKCFTEHVRVIIVGDDLSLTIDPLFHKWFNHKSINENSKRIGMEYHFASDKFEYFENTTFLGHGFKKTVVNSDSGLTMFYPTIDSEKMRCSLLQYNEEGTLAMSIIRACALRNETFANEGDRIFFDDYITWLRDRYYSNDDDNVRAAWNAYLTDEQLHELYSGFNKLGLSVESSHTHYHNVILFDKSSQTIVQEIKSEISIDHIPVVLIETC